MAMTRKADIETAFKDLCENDREFRASIEGTTKSIEAIYMRLSKWSERLSGILGQIVKAPTLKDGRIVLA
jgi:hypothetical protein